MKIKIINLAVALVIFLGFTVTSAYAGTFSDNFDDGNTNGWISAPQGTGYPLGNWRVSNGVLIQDAGPDHVKFLVNNLPLTNQSIETKIYFHDMGYAGITIWYYDIDNWVDIYIYPAGSYLRVLERIDGIRQEVNYPFTSDKNTWYTMRVDANSLAGELAIYLDGVLITNQTVATTHRTGLSGVNSGNAGGSFDDFVIPSDSIIDSLTNKAQCKNGGWKIFTNPTFKNQGACISYLEK